VVVVSVIGLRDIEVILSDPDGYEEAVRP
jgi:hypothetical protein